MMAKGAKMLGLVGGLLCGLVLLPGLAAHAATSLPNGASTLQEGYQDWQVFCRAPDSAKPDGVVKCVMTQQVRDMRSHRRVLSLQMESDGEQIRGTATVPFGLDLVHGLTLTNSIQPLGDTYTFSTCLPTGCLVPLSFDDRQWSLLLQSDTATLTGMSLSGQPMRLAFSTRGLAQGLQRMRSLMQ